MSSGSPIITATGDTSGDEHKGVSSCVAALAKLNFETDPDITYDYHRENFSSADDFSAFKNHLFRFETDSELPEDLEWNVSVPEEVLVTWYKELLKALRESEPKDPKEATKLVVDTLDRVPPYSLCILDLQGFLYFHGLPNYYSVREHTSGGGYPPFVDYDPVDLLDAPVFQLWTLPVIRNRVTDGGGFTVSVEVKDFYLLSPDILFMVSERRRALAKGDHRRARELLHQINTTGDYEIVDFLNEKMLTKKYKIRLRGIRAPEIGMPYGTMARDELARMVTGTRLKISVYYFDDLMRCVGDVYNKDKLLQEILLKKRVASCCWEKMTKCT